MHSCDSIAETNEFIENEQLTRVVCYFQNLIMTYIKTDIPQPGIVELLFYKGSTGKALSKLAHTLLHGPSQLTLGERELIASYVSDLNKCEFCHESHSASANFHLNDGGNTVDSLKIDPDKALVSEKMKSLLKIAGQVQKSGRDVTLEAIESARHEGASDEDIHDTVLIAAAFCMYNRYVDGLGTNLPAEKEEYLTMGKRMAKIGYKYPPLFLRKFVIWTMKRNERKKLRASS
jgi:uncharacterized peroxidase-related enzyme